MLFILIYHYFFLHAYATLRMQISSQHQSIQVTQKKNHPVILVIYFALVYYDDDPAHCRIKTVEKIKTNILINDVYMYRNQMMNYYYYR